MKANCKRCAGRGYRVHWRNGKGRSRPCGSCSGTGIQKARKAAEKATK